MTLSVDWTVEAMEHAFETLCMQTILTCHTRGQKQDARDQNWNRIKINKEFKKI
jgi:hypothetical protein